MRLVTTFDNTPKGHADLYQMVLVETSVGKYFEQVLRYKSDKMESAAEVRMTLDEVEIEILKNSLMKLYLEDFYNFCQKLGGDTATIMGGILKAKADQRAINITLNSFHTPLNEPNMRDGDGWPTRKSLYPSIGFLYPEGTDLLVKVSDEAGLGQAMEKGGGRLRGDLAGALERRHREQVHRRRVLRARGGAAGAGLREPDALRVLLRVREAEGAGVPQPDVDHRVHRAAAARRDPEVRPHLLPPLAVEGRQGEINQQPAASSQQPAAARGLIYFILRGLGVGLGRVVFVLLCCAPWVPPWLCCVLRDACAQWWRSAMRRAQEAR